MQSWCSFHTAGKTFQSWTTYRLHWVFKAEDALPKETGSMAFEAAIYLCRCMIAMNVMRRVSTKCTNFSHPLQIADLQSGSSENTSKKLSSHDSTLHNNITLYGQCPASRIFSANAFESLMDKAEKWKINPCPVLSYYWLFMKLFLFFCPLLLQHV